MGLAAADLPHTEMGRIAAGKTAHIVAFRDDRLDCRLELLERIGGLGDQIEGGLTSGMGKEAETGQSYFERRQRAAGPGQQRGQLLEFRDRLEWKDQGDMGHPAAVMMVVLLA